MAATIRELTPRKWGQSLQSCMDEASRYLTGWMGHFQLCSKEGTWVFAYFDAHLRRRLRAIKVRHRKRPRYLVRHLVARGVGLRSAKGLAYCSHRLWYRSNHRAVTMAYPNKWFHERLVSLVRRWHELNPAPQVSAQLELAL